MTDTADRTATRAAEAEASYEELVSELRATFERGHTRPVPWRRAQLEGMLRLLEEGEAELIGALRDDLGRPETEAFAADIGHARGEIRYMLRHLDRWTRPRRVGLPITVMPGRGRVVPEPLGVVLVIAPWNYPVQLLLEPVAAAIAAGNAVVAKPSELAPACSAVLARLIPRYLDDKAVTVVEGGVPETTALLTQRFDHVFFTGSTRVGQVVMEAAARHLTPVTLELGGKSPAIVAADADLDVTARRLVFGKCLNAGQTCIAPDYVLAEASVRDLLVDRIVSTIEEFYGSDPSRSDSYGRIINATHLTRLESYLADHGGTVVTGGAPDAEQRYLGPTVVVDPDPQSTLMQEEIFGPILPVLAVDGVDDAIDFINRRPKPLALYVFSESARTIDDVIARTSSGGVCVNHTLMHILPAELPFGGVGPSGIGAYHGRTGFDTFSHHKSVLQKPARPDPRLLYPPYTALKLKLVRKAL